MSEGQQALAERHVPLVGRGQYAKQACQRCGRQIVDMSVHLPVPQEEAPEDKPRQYFGSARIASSEALFPGKMIPVEVPTEHSSEKFVAPSGATSSKGATMFSLIPIRALRRLALRFALGLSKHGRDNWRKGITDEQWIEDRYNHAIEHLMTWWDKRNGYTPDDGDDDLGAAMWGCAILIEVDERRK